MSCAVLLMCERAASLSEFCCHCRWDSLFVELVDSLAAHLEGAAQDETFPWLDIFAINQDDTGGRFSAMAELDDGRTLAQVIELSRATLVVLDKDRVAPFARLYENACCCCCLFNCARPSSTCVLA